MAFIAENLILINFFTFKVPDMISLGETLEQKNPQRNLICNSSNDIISVDFDQVKNEVKYVLHMCYVTTRTMLDI